MRRVYTSTAHFRAPYDTANISFAGLGVLGSDHAAYDINQWPKGRSYFSTHFYRAPYQAGFYQSGALRGSDPQAMTGPQKVALVVMIAGAVAFGLWGDKLRQRA